MLCFISKPERGERREERGERRATMTVSEVTSAGGTQFIRVPLVNVSA